jgi:hypothetical protein
MTTTDTHGYSGTDYADAVVSGHVPAPEQPETPETGVEAPEHVDIAGGPEDGSEPIFSEAVAAEQD